MGWATYLLKIQREREKIKEKHYINKLNLKQLTGTNISNSNFVKTAYKLVLLDVIYKPF